MQFAHFQGRKPTALGVGSPFLRPTWLGQLPQVRKSCCYNKGGWNDLPPPDILYFNKLWSYAVGKHLTYEAPPTPKFWGGISKGSPQGWGDRGASA